MALGTPSKRSGAFIGLSSCVPERKIYHPAALLESRIAPPLPFLGLLFVCHEGICLSTLHRCLQSQPADPAEIRHSAPPSFLDVESSEPPSVSSAQRRMYRLSCNCGVGLEIPPGGSRVALAVLLALIFKARRLQTPSGQATRVFVALEPVAMRKGYDGLYGLVTRQLGKDPRSGDLFVFTNSQRNRLKIFYWDGTGLWVCDKRLEKGCFSWPSPQDSGSGKVRLSPAALAMLLGGIDLGRAKIKKWRGETE